jgi:hypothetical protein
MAYGLILPQHSTAFDDEPVVLAQAGVRRAAGAHRGAIRVF